MESSKDKINGRLLIRKCHLCGHLNESSKELTECLSCRKAFLPLNYFAKVHQVDAKNYKHLYAELSELSEEDLISGIYVIW